jgi:hypothetical protein
MVKITVIETLDIDIASFDILRFTLQNSLLLGWLVGFFFFFWGVELCNGVALLD